MKLHVVSFQVPYPPSYGGIVDVYYKLKALKEAGCTIILHTYKYRLEEAHQLKEVAEEIFYYKRFMGVSSLLSYLPYTVYSRRNRLLLKRLTEDDSPILFEGLYTCYFLNHKSLKNRLKLVRAHNVEHDYYMHLGRSAVSWVKRCYYMLEARKLYSFEKKVKYADAILAITPADQQHFMKHYPTVPAYWTPCFYNDILPDHTIGTDPYVLYHGNLSVDENVHAALFILDNLVPSLDSDIQIVFAGNSPVPELIHKVAEFPNVKLIANPSEEEMNRLITRARINLLLTFQRTGIKLKLIHALFKGHGHCLVNSQMLSDEALEPLCVVADEPTELIKQIRRLYAIEPNTIEVEQRIRHLQIMYDNYANACKILSICESLKKK
ncbi:glycosyltransferase family 1 protein [Bacteroides sp.]